MKAQKTIELDNGYYTFTLPATDETRVERLRVLPKNIIGQDGFKVEIDKNRTEDEIRHDRDPDEYIRLKSIWEANSR